MEPKSSLDLSNSNHSLVLPTGGTGTRPASPKAGAMRYNSDTNLMEYYNGTEWLNTDGSKNDTQQHRYLVWTGAGTQNTGAQTEIKSYTKNSEHYYSDSGKCNFICPSSRLSKNGTKQYYE